MKKIANTWRLAPVAAAQHELTEVRAALGFLPQGYAAIAGLDRLADLLAASEPSTPSPAVSTEHDEPITVTVDNDPRGVSVGVWQGSHCIYSGAHPLPAAPGVSTVEDKPAAYLTLDEDGSPCMLFFDVVEARGYCALGEEPEALYRRPAPAAGDALDALRELVECDSLKKRIASMQVCVMETEDDVQELDAMMSDLARRQPAAWDAARSALAAQRKGDA